MPNIIKININSIIIMKYKLFFSAAVISVVFFTTSCKKEPKPSVIGFWEGSSGKGANNTGTFTAFLFDSNNQVIAYNTGTDTSNADKFFGTYSLANKTITMLFEDNTFTYVGTVNNNEITGTMDAIPSNPVVSGHFIVTKQ